ncbi:hypothetical protein ACHAW6_005292 [Cyclotella cf. meneghiniana]
MQKQETCQEFSQDANVPISKELMVTTGIKHALQCGGLTQAWCKWRCLMAVQHTRLNWKHHWTAAFNKQREISCLTGGTVMSQADAVVDDAQWSSQMITSLDNLANAAVQINDTVEKLVVSNKQITNTILKLQEDNTKYTKLFNVIQQWAGHNPYTAQHQSTTPKWDTKGYCHTHGYKDITAKPAGLRSLDIKTMPLDKIQWEVTRRTNHGNQKDDGGQQQRQEEKKQIMK